MNDTDGFRCARCGTEDADPLGAPPFANEIGRRVAEEICPECWDDWKDRQMLLINHYGLNLQDREARAFLMDNMEKFLFEEGEGEAGEGGGDDGAVGPFGEVEG